MPFYNQTLEIEGNIGRDPEMRYTPQGDAVTSFSVAVNNEYEKDGQKVKTTMWVRATAWKKTAEQCQKVLRKGMRVKVVGTLVFDKATGKPRMWDKQDGSQDTSFEMKAQSVYLSLWSVGGGDGFNFDQSPEVPPEDDIPF